MVFAQKNIVSQMVNPLLDNYPILLVSPDVRSSVMGVAKSLEQSQLLGGFVTTFATKTTDPIDGLAGFFTKPFRGRQIPDWLWAKTHLHPYRELARLISSKTIPSEISKDRIWEWAETGFDRSVAQKWAGKFPIIYGCEHASVETFSKQKQRGGRNILWQVIAHHQTSYRLIQRALEECPEAQTAYAMHAFQTASRVNGRKDRQYADADLIIANSPFVRDSFIAAGVSQEKVISVPTGCPEVSLDACAKRPSGPRIFLCAGNQCVRKGVHHLLQAWKLVKPSPEIAQLWLVGKMELPARLLENLPRSIVIQPPVFKAELQTIFKRVHTLVLPTLCEGRAHVILEALASGLPVITTPNSGCSDVVLDGINGVLIPPFDSEGLACAIGKMIALSEKSLYEMSQMSLDRAKRWTINDFAQRHNWQIGQFVKKNK